MKNNYINIVHNIQFGFKKKHPNVVLSLLP